jgi:hypothetical protein
LTNLKSGKLEGFKMSKDINRWKARAATEDERDLLKSTYGDPDDKSVAEHRKALAQVLNRAWRSGVLEPDQIEPIFDRIVLPAGADAKFPLDFYRPADSWGEDETHKAFIIPKEGMIPQVAIEGEEILVPTFKVGNAIDWNLDYARDARWDVVAKAIEVYTNGFVQRLNDEGWTIVLTSAASHGSVVTDAAAGAGVFTKRLLTNLMTNIKRLTGGRGSRLTDLYMSPEAIADIRNFDTTVLDDVTLRNILITPEDGVPQLYGVRLHDVPDFGVGEDYQLILENDLSVSLGSDEEFVIGLDLENRDSFVMPVREDMQMFDDPTLHRRQRAGVYGWLEVGFAALDNRRATVGSL